MYCSELFTALDFYVSLLHLFYSLSFSFIVNMYSGILMSVICCGVEVFKPPGPKCVCSIVSVL